MIQSIFEESSYFQKLDYSILIVIVTEIMIVCVDEKICGDVFLS